MKDNEIPDSCKQMMKDHKGMMNMGSKMHSEKGMKMDSTHNMHMDAMMKSNNKMKMDCMSQPDSTKTMNEMKHDMKNMDQEMNSIVHEGVIDLQSIDKNKDGKVFQDQMDFNVISDKAGECPLCKMTLKEVTLEKAKENLLKHNFKVKNTVEQK